MGKPLKITLIIISLVFLSPFLLLLAYLAYDRMIMPPPPTWTSPPFTPDTIKAPWIRNEDGGAGYFLDFIAKHKENNAFVNYINAFSSFTIIGNEDDLYNQEEIIFEKGWSKNYPLVEDNLKENQKVMEEIHQGVLLKHCELPPTPYSVEAPNLNFLLTHHITRLMVVQSLKLESQNHFSEALTYYLDGIQFGKDLCLNNQNLVNHMAGIAIIGTNLEHLQRLIGKDVLTERDYQQIIQTIQQIDKQLTPISDALEVEYRIGRTLLSKLLNDPKEFSTFWSSGSSISGKLNASFYFIILQFNKGKIERNFVNYTQEVLSTLTTKTYHEFMNINWGEKSPKDLLNKIIIFDYSKAYHQQVLKAAELRLTQLQSAIHLYHLQKKQWPKSLDDLKEYLSPIPKDPFTDQSFLWGQENGKPFAYSSGPDNKDDKAQITYDPTNGTLSTGDIRP